MSERRAVTKVVATRYARSAKAVKKQIPDELCATTGWHRDHARKAVRTALVLKPVRPRAPRPPLYGEALIEALRFCWAVQGTPCGRLLAAALPNLVPRLRRFEEPRIDDGTAAQLLSIAPGDDRAPAHGGPGQTRRPRSVPHQARNTAERLHSSPYLGQWNEAVPGFVEIDLVGHEGGNNQGEFCFTLDIY